MSKEKRIRNDVSLVVRAINRAALAKVPVVGTTITELTMVNGAEYQLGESVVKDDPR